MRLSAREATILVRLVEAMVDPGGRLPPARATDAVRAVDRWLARAPASNRALARALLLALELSSLAGPGHAPLRRLPSERRRWWLERVEHSPAGLPVKLLRRMIQLSYYGSDEVLLALGYDARANVERGRALRLREGRP